MRINKLLAAGAAVVAAAGVGLVALPESPASAAPGAHFRGRVNDTPNNASITVKCPGSATRGFAKAGQTVSVVRQGAGPNSPTFNNGVGTVTVVIGGKTYSFKDYGSQAITSNLPCSGFTVLTFRSSNGTSHKLRVAFVGVAS